MRRRRYILMMAIPLLGGWFGCTMPTMPTGTDTDAGRPGDALDICSTTPDLGFDLVAVADLPVLNDDLTFGTLGIEGAQALALDLTPTGGFCSFDVSPAVQTVIDEAENLIATGQNAAARVLLATLLQTDGADTGVPKLINVKLPGADETRQRMRDLLVAASADQDAGGTGEDFQENARDVFTEWVFGEQDPLAKATLEEALVITAEAQLLGIEDVESEGSERATKLADDSLNEFLLAFNECTPSIEFIRGLLGSLSTAMALGVNTGDSFQSIFRVIAQASLRLGVDPDLVEQLFGKDIPEPVCSARFTFSRSVSDGATLSGEGSMCGGGLWQGTVTLSGGPGPISSSGEFTFTIFAGDDGAETTIPTSGTFERYSFTDPLHMTFIHHAETQTADIRIFSAAFVGGVGGTIFTDIGPILFLSVFMPDPWFTVDLLPNPDCPTQ